MCVQSTFRYKEGSNEDLNQPKELSQTRVVYPQRALQAFTPSCYDILICCFLSLLKSKGSQFNLQRKAPVRRCTQRNDDAEISSGAIHRGGKSSHSSFQGPHRAVAAVHSINSASPREVWSYSASSSEEEYEYLQQE